MHDADRASDAHRLAAALQAAARVARRPLDLQLALANPPEGNPRSAEWLFWLSARTPPSNGPDHDTNIVLESAEAAQAPIPGWIVPNPGSPGAAAFLDPVRLWRRTPPPVHPPDAAYWTDGFGQGLLTAVHRGRATEWRFSGRFDPAWTDLPLGSAFPSWLRALVFQDGDPAPPDPVHDSRLADPSQCHPADSSAAGPDITLPRVSGPPIDLHAPLWAFAAALFVLDRLLAAPRQPAAAAVAVAR